MVVRYGYQPIRPPEKGVTQEDMWKTLAKHAQTEVEVHLLRNAARVGASPKEKLRRPLPLVWKQPVKTGEISGYVLTRCGRFSISKDSVMGKPMYTAWRRSETRDLPPLNLGVRLTRNEAERLCEMQNEHEHSDAHP
jgi:hypothetical protein